MKTFTYLLLFLVSFGAFSQATSTFEPVNKGDIVIRTEEQYVPLEKQQVAVKKKISASTYVVGVGTAKIVNNVEGASSPVRVFQQKELTLIVNAGTNECDHPVDIISIFKLEEKSRRRSVTVAKANNITSSLGDIQYVPFLTEKYGKNSYKITIQYLMPGEYAITIEGSRDVFNMFGVDSPPLPTKREKKN